MYESFRPLFASHSVLAQAARQLHNVPLIMRALPLALAFAFVVLLFAPRADAIEELSAQDVIDWAQSGMGYSYWWGNGRWRTDKASTGSCSGSCPRCTHSGSYGADCSGFVAKVWRVPTSTPRTTNGHPYSTWHFYNNTTHWKRVDRGSAKQADAMVYRSKSGGHVFLYDRADPWGTMWAYECKSCRGGCTHNLRTATSTYRAIRRNSLVEPPHSCTQNDECSTGLCAWNGDIYCCRSKGFTGTTCFTDAECSSNQVCANNGTKFVCTNPISCDNNSSGTGGSAGSSGTGGTAGSGGTGGGTPGCSSMTQEQPWTHASLGPSFLLLGLIGAWRRRRRQTTNQSRS